MTHISFHTNDTIYQDI